MFISFPSGEDSLSATVCRAWVGTGLAAGGDVGILRTPCRLAARPRPWGEACVPAPDWPSPCGEATPRVPRLFRAASHALGLGTPFWPPRAAPWCPLRCPSPSWEVADPSQRVVPRHRLTPGPTSAPRPASSRDAACSGLLSVACSTLVSVETRTRGGPGEPVDLACGFPGDLL